VYNKRTFTARYGDPLAFVFKTQVWKCLPGKQCDICFRAIRYACVLKRTQSENVLLPPEIGKLVIGKCCFHYFKKWNTGLYYKLLFAYQNVQTFTQAVERDKQMFGLYTGVKVRLGQWKRVRRQARTRLRLLKEQNTPAPVADVLTLQEVLNRRPHRYKRPSSAIRWYDRQITQLQERLQNLPAIK
jgi:hypothetical protein